MKNKISQSSSLEKILQANLEASNLKVRELQAELLGYESRTKELEAKLAHVQQLSKKLRAGRTPAGHRRDTGGTPAEHPGQEPRTSRTCPKP